MRYFSQTGGIGNMMFQMAFVMSFTNDFKFYLTDFQLTRDFFVDFVKMNNEEILKAKTGLIQIESFDGRYNISTANLGNNKQKFKDLIQNNGGKYTKEKCVCHLRFGDYLKNADRAKTVLSTSYIKKALEELGIGLEEVLFVTDDREHAKSILGNKIRLSDPRNTALDDFNTIMNAENIIISASTFSWWAAYLSNAKLIIFPRYWAEDFGVSSNDPSTIKHGIELIPQHESNRWIIMDNLKYH